MATQKGNPRHNRQANLSDVTRNPRSSYGSDAYTDRAASSSSGYAGIGQSGAGSSDSSSRASRSASSQSSVSRSTAGSPRSSRSSADRIGKQLLTGSEAYAGLRKKRKRRKVVMGVLIALLVVVLAGGGAAFAYVINLNNNLQSGVDQGLRDALNPVDTPTDPFYMLLLGIDSSAARENDEFYEGDNFRSDSMMLARIDPKDRKVTLVSIRRDVLIEDMGVNGEYGDQKINAAHSLGGPTLAVQTVSELAGVPISHYAEIDFDGFREVVDALGGIEVDVPIEIDDPEAGGYLAAGVQTLDGDQALTLCRSRHAYDDYGEGDNYRTANQRLVLAAIAEKLLESDIGTIANTATSISKCVTTDMGVAEIVAIAQSMQGINANDDIYSGVIPAPSAMIGDVWYDLIDEEEWEAMMARVNAGLPPNEEDIIDELTGTVMAKAGNIDEIVGGDIRALNPKIAISVRNGNGVSGVTETASKLLKGAGYVDIDTGNANDFSYNKTIIVYKETKSASDAKMIARILGVGAAQLDDDDEYLFESDVLIVLGSDFE